VSFAKIPRRLNFIHVCYTALWMLLISNAPNFGEAHLIGNSLFTERHKDLL
jgi:hypothetical protein